MRYLLLQVFNFLHNLVPFHPVGYTALSLKNSHHRYSHNGDAENSENSEVREKFVTTKFVGI